MKPSGGEARSPGDLWFPQPAAARGEDRLDILDFSTYGNLIDRDSDARLESELTALGIGVRVCPIARGPSLPPQLARRVWLRYDLRCPDDLRHVAALALRLRQARRLVFPEAGAIIRAEDKWETYQTLRQAALPTVDSRLASEPAPDGGLTILKPRVRWGGEGIRILAGPASGAIVPGESPADYICQPFIVHERTLTVAAAGGRAFAAIEKQRSDMDFRTDGDFGLPPRQVPVSPKAGRLACDALAAIGLVAGTVDLIESGGRLVILEVNSAPCLVYDSIPALDLAKPMVRSVIHDLEETVEDSPVHPV